METAISLLSDLIMLLFNLALYIKLTPLKKENALYRSLMYGGSCLIGLCYILTAYVFHMPYASASFLCLSVPSFLLFLSLARYKSSRFLVTFCFVDTVTFIIAGCAKILQLRGGLVSQLLSCGALLVLSLGSYILLRPYCSRYRALMEQVTKGWAPMAVSTVFIYILLIAFTAYPSPLKDRFVYLPLFFLLCVTILSFYVVFIVLIVQKAKLTRANLLLQQQQHWHELAYLDELTQVANQAAYADSTEELQNNRGQGRPCALLIFDIDNFKHINDTYGHHTGNTVLRQAASFFLSYFSQQRNMLARRWEYFHQRTYTSRKIGADPAILILLRK